MNQKYLFLELIKVFGADGVLHRPEEILLYGDKASIWYSYKRISTSDKGGSDEHGSST